LWFLPAALVIDLVAWRRLAGRTGRDAAMAAGFSLAFTLGATIDLTVRRAGIFSASPTRC
jgi:hypothetical protein